MSAVLESLFIENLTRQYKEDTCLNSIFRTLRLTPELVDAVLRAAICCLAGITIGSDLLEVKRISALALYTTFKAESTRLLVVFVYIIFFGLIVSSVWNISTVIANTCGRRSSWQKLPQGPPPGDGDINGTNGHSASGLQLVNLKEDVKDK
eukprot:gnl/MRDRNA2_/MRDRNA2_148366_c0_seq1.p1 gnl/MRDRNA2_/MRDRNA2_148366_c0~~gnl/MRDRNA2_/MRDRNA2_148366_c0_seq1.p1  ORF type:complete len:172 (-),score=25.25 gnl/MRDRNA2_/MRDRNA2_148366_c0_seq1:69-521(-)